MTVIIFYDTPSEKCDVYSVSKGKLKILRMLWEQERCKNERERQRAKDKTGDMHLRGIETTQTGARM